MLRYSLRTLGAAVTAIAIGCAALLNANHSIAITAWTLVFLVLSLATIAAVLTRRGFWTGFAIAGWLYLLVGIGPLSGYHNGNLLTTAALQWGAEALQQANQTPPSATAVDSGIEYVKVLQALVATEPTSRGAVWAPTLQQSPSTEPANFFMNVGQSLWTLLLALLGGWFGAFIMVRRPAQTESSD